MRSDSPLVSLTLPLSSKYSTSLILLFPPLFRSMDKIVSLLRRDLKRDKMENNVQMIVMK